MQDMIEKYWAQNEKADRQIVQLVELAGFEFVEKWELVNQYWKRSGYVPGMGSWWLFDTGFGMLRVGWRKRVLEIDWSNMKYRGVITDDNVTKSSTLVHAHTINDALKYLQTLRREIGKSSTGEQT